MAPEESASTRDRIRQARRRAGLSHAQLAGMTGLSKSYLVRLETDATSNPSLEVLRRIADALDITVADLVGATKLEFGIEDASIRWRKGEEPRTRERWRYILDSLRASRTFDDNKG